MKVTNFGQNTELVSNSGSTSAGGVIVEDSGGYYPPGATLEEILAAIGAGTAPDSFLTNTLGGKDKIEDLGTLGASVTVNLANANVFLGVMAVDPTIGTIGWTAGRSSTIRLTLTQDGTGGNTPNLPSVTWIGGEPTWNLTEGTTTHILLFSDDGGTVIWGAVLSGGSSIAASGAVGALLIADDHSTPLVFEDILQTEAGDDFLYSDVG